MHLRKMVASVSVYVLIAAYAAPVLSQDDVTTIARHRATVEYYADVADSTMKMSSTLGLAECNSRFVDIALEMIGVTSKSRAEQLLAEAEKYVKKCLLTLDVFYVDGAGTYLGETHTRR